MKMNFFKMLVAVVLTFVVFEMLFSVEVVAEVMDFEVPSGGNAVETITERSGKTFNTVKLILQLSAIGVFLYTGVKYMFASADQKADLKKSMVMVFIGTALVFALTYVVDFVQRIADDLLG